MFHKISRWVRRSWLRVGVVSAILYGIFWFVCFGYITGIPYTNTPLILCSLGFGLLVGAYNGFDYYRRVKENPEHFTAHLLRMAWFYAHDNDLKEAIGMAIDVAEPETRSDRL